LQVFSDEWRKCGQSAQILTDKWHVATAEYAQTEKDKHPKRFGLQDKEGS
jgi:hypothetical protein